MNAYPQAGLAYYLYDLPFDVGPAGCYSDHSILCISHPGHLCHDNINSAMAKKCACILSCCIFSIIILSVSWVALLYLFLSGSRVALPFFVCSMFHAHLPHRRHRIHCASSIPNPWRIFRTEPIAHLSH